MASLTTLFFLFYFLLLLSICVSFLYTVAGHISVLVTSVIKFSTENLLSKKSFSSSNDTNNLAPSHSKVKQSHLAKSFEGVGKSRSKKAAFEDQNHACPVSYSSGIDHDNGLQTTRSDSPCSSNNSSQKQSASRTSRRALTAERERYSRAVWFEDNTVDGAQRIEKFTCAGVGNVSSESHIEGKKHQERSSNSKTTSHGCHPNGKPPRAPLASLTVGGLTQKPSSHTNGVAHESPRKQVTERLSQSCLLPSVDSKEFDHVTPITVEDIYNRLSPEAPDEETKSFKYEETSSFEERRYRFYESTQLRAKLESLEKEKNELEKELDRRSTEWSTNLEKYQLEQCRLRERVRELAEQNVSLQHKELDHESRLIQVKDLSERMEIVNQENQSLHQNLSELQDKFRAAEEDLDCFKRNYIDIDEECKELHTTVTRLVRTRNEQEKTIEGLREGLSKQARKNGPSENKFDQIEQLRLTGVEQSLRKEVESYRHEVDSLRHENVKLLHRLKASSKDGGFSTFKLDQELQSRVDCLQSQGLCLTNESAQLCSKLLEYIKERACHSSLETKHGNEALDNEFILESEMKLQGFNRAAESLSRSLQTVSDVLREKSCTCSENTVKSHLKPDALMTSLLMEKVYAKEVDVERLEAELATAVRGKHILSVEVNNAMDHISSIINKMKDLEMQVIKKDESIYLLQKNLQKYKKEINIVNKILPKVSKERDGMWEDLQKYKENNMLLISEVGILKKKIEDLDEDVLYKEGQITILKDAFAKPCDLF